VAILKLVPPEQAQGKVKEAYDMFAPLGMVPAPLQMYSPSPELISLRAKNIGYFRGHPNLSVGLLALIRMLVAEELKYYYCLSLNTGLLKTLGIADEDAAAKVLSDPASAPLNDKDKALLLFVLKAVKTPEEVTAEDTQKLRDLGWSDGDIIDATAHGAGMVADGIMFKAFKMDQGQSC
jgi:alkylhydroperoxidase family enzyme